MIIERGMVMQNEIFWGKSINELHEIAGCEKTERATLYELVNFAQSQRAALDPIVFLGLLRIIAENKSADGQLLDHVCDIALSEVKEQREGLNYGCLQMLFKNIASNLNTESVTFKKLLDNKIHVREYIVENPSLSDELLLYIVENTRNNEILAIAAKQLATRYKAVLNKK